MIMHSVRTLACLVLLVGAASADEKQGDAPKKPAKEMTDVERETALKKAEELNERLVALTDRGEYRQAVTLARQVIRVQEEALGPAHPDVATSLNNLAYLLDALGKYAESMTLNARALRIREQALGPEHLDVAQSLNNIASLFETRGAFEKAKPLYERALKIRQAKLGPEHPDVATSLNNLASLLDAQGAYADATSLFRRAMKIYENVYGLEHVDVALCLNNIASSLEAQGAYAEARALLERAVAIYGKVLGSDHVDVAMSLNNLASLLEEQGAFAKARPLYERALRIWEKALGPDHPDVATSLNNLASLLDAQGSYAEARPLYERALRIHEEAFGPEHPDVALSLNNLACLFETQGALAEARPLYERALRIREQGLGSEHPDVAVSLNNLASLLEEQGAYAKARLLYERALEIEERALGPEHPDVAVSLGNLAHVLDAQGAYAKARPLYERALRINEETHGPTHPQVAVDLGNLASLLQEQGAYVKARSLYERALKIDEKAFGPEHPEVATSLHNLAWLLEAQEAFTEAKPLHERALRIREEALGPEHPDVARSLSSLAWLSQRQGQYERAARMLRRCLQIVDCHMRRSVTGLLPSDRLRLVRSLRFFLDRWLTLAPHLGRSGFAASLRFKGSLARVAAAERRVAHRSGEDATVRISELRAAERRLGKLANAAPSFFDKKKRNEWQQAYAKAAAEREKLALSLQREFAPLRQGMERLDLKISDVQAHMRDGAVLIDFLRVDDAYLAWVLSPTGKATRIDLGDAQKIEEATVLFARAAARRSETKWRDAGVALRELVFAPIAKHLAKDVAALYICPDAALAAVPFATLPGREDGNLLLDEYLISTVSMGQDLVPWPDAPPPGSGALVFGGVDYGEAEIGDDEAKAARAFVDRAPRGQSFVYLHATKSEAETIRRSLGEDAAVLLGTQATENRLRALSEGKRVLHLATHGFVRTDLLADFQRRPKRWLGAGMERQLAQGHDPMLLAGLALAGANPREGGHGDDGILTALEASHLHLDGVELVVLSACQTAAGRAESGEGVIGLVQGFQQAGAKRVIGSLWKVSDAATEALMVKFYELWSPKTGKGVPAAQALRAAQQHVRSRPKWKHPYYWAAWSVWGPGD